ncbi:hypothetical protein Hanom_Chr03g00237301 [Helianthus anomalus]
MKGKTVAELHQKFRGGVTSCDPIYILYKYLDKIIEGTILYNFKIFGQKIENFTLLTETFGGTGAPPLYTILRQWGKIVRFFNLL